MKLKPYIPIFVILLLVSISFVGMANQSEELFVDGDEDAWSIQSSGGPISIPGEEWNRTFGGTELEMGMDVDQTVDGGYIIIGHTKSFGKGLVDIWLIKVDKDGIELWNRTYGGSQNDFSHAIRETNDNGFILVGWTGSYGNGGFDIWAIKTDSNGSEQWNRTYGCIGDEKGLSVDITNDNGYIISGVTDSYGAGMFDIWLVKIDGSGNELWNKTFGFEFDDWGQSVKQTGDSGYIIAGSFFPHPNGSGFSDICLIKTDSNGNEHWNRTLGGESSDSGYSVYQTEDDCYILVGKNYSDMELIKTDISGNCIWQKRFGGSSLDSPSDVLQTSDGGYVIVGTTWSFGPGYGDIWIIKTDRNGSILWNKIIGGINNDNGRSIKETDDGGYIIVGTKDLPELNNGSIWIIKITKNGEDFPPLVNIINPKTGYSHFSGIPILPTAFNLLGDTLTLGGFRRRPIQVNVTDNDSENADLIVMLEIDGEDKGLGIWNPETGFYEWQWTSWAFGNYFLKVRVEDIFGALVGWDEIKVWNFCLFP